MRFHIITLFPKAFDSYLSESILKRAIEDEKIAVFFYNPRNYADGKIGHAVRVDKKPYGGGPGMVIQALPVIKALEAAQEKIVHSQSLLKLRGGRLAPQAGGMLKQKSKVKIIFLNPGGKQFDTSYAKNLVSKKYTDIVLIGIKIMRRNRKNN